MRIGQLAEITGTAPTTLRFYEDAGLLPPAVRTSGGYRDYTDESVARVAFIRRGQTAGLSLAQIRQILEIRDGGTAPCEHVRGLLASRATELDEQIAQLTALRETITRLRHEAGTAGPADCDPEQVCSFL